MIRRHISFTGWVQGVGFRYRARHAASLYICTGWVRNEWDGSVTMEIQGEPEAIDQVIHAIGRGRYVQMDCKLLDFAFFVYNRANRNSLHRSI